MVSGVFGGGGGGAAAAAVVVVVVVMIAVFVVEWLRRRLSRRCDRWDPSHCGYCDFWDCCCDLQHYRNYCYLRCGCWGCGDRSERRCWTTRTTKKTTTEMIDKKVADDSDDSTTNATLPSQHDPKRPVVVAVGWIEVVSVAWTLPTKSILQCAVRGGHKGKKWFSVCLLVGCVGCRVLIS